MARVLVTDDNADMRQLLSTILVEEGHTAVLAQDGQKALEVMRQEVPDILVLDVMMPTKDGFMVLRELKGDELRSRVKVLVLTAKHSEQDWVKAYKLGADYYLTKPFELDEFLEALEFLLHTSHKVLAKRRQDELDKAQLLSRLENLFEDGQPR